MKTKQHIAEQMAHKFQERFAHAIQRSGNEQQVLSHYTSLLSLMGMVESNELWMSKSNFLNDTKELVHFFEVVDNLLEKLRENADSRLHKLFIRELERALARFEQKTGDRQDVYIFSLSHSEDSLALWYNYAQGDGYNIGFSVSDLLEQLKLPREKASLLYGYVLYDRKEQQTFLLSLLKAAYEEIEPHGLAVAEELLPAYFQTLIAACAVFFKNPAFESEQEYRVALVMDSEAENPKVLFRPQNGIIIPYITLAFEQQLPVRHITIGPKNNIDVAQYGLEHYLRSKGYPVEQIRICKSVAALRY